MTASAPQAPKAPKFNAINLDDFVKNWTAADINVNEKANSDFMSRFPGVVQANQAAQDEAYKGLTGPLDPTLQTSFTDEGIGKALSAFGGGSGAGVGGSGSASRNTVGQTVATDAAGAQDYYRNLLNQLTSSPLNQPETAGPTGADIASASIFNTTGGRAAAGQAYNAAVQNANAQAATNAANTQGTIGTGLAVAGLVTTIAIAI